MEFAGKSAVITGSARGIGAAIAIEFARQGARVVLADILEAGETLAAIRSFGGTALVERTDVTSAEDNERAIARAATDFGQLDHFVAAAAFSLRGPFWEQEIEDAKRTLDVTMWGVYLGLRSAARQMIVQGKGGSMIVVGSPHAIIPEPACMAYNTAKAGVHQMALTAATELIPHRIRVNLVQPGWTDTPGERRFFTDEEIAEQAQQLPWGRLARPDEIARAVLFLASPQSEYITGATLGIDGGLLLPKNN